MKPEYEEKYEIVSRENLAEILHQGSIYPNLAFMVKELSNDCSCRDEACLAVENQRQSSLNPSSKSVKARRRLTFKICTSGMEKHSVCSPVVNSITKNASRNKKVIASPNSKTSSNEQIKTAQPATKQENERYDKKSCQTFATTQICSNSENLNAPSFDESYAAMFSMTQKKASNRQKESSFPLLQTISEEAKLRGEDNLPKKKSSRSFLKRRSSLFQKVKKSVSRRKSSNDPNEVLMEASSMPCLNIQEEAQSDVKAKSKISNICKNIRSLFTSQLQKQKKNVTSTRKFNASEIPKEISLMEVLRNEERIQKTFGDFLKKEFSDENLDFWLEVEEFKKLNTFEEAAVKIYNTYIASFSTREMNIESHTRKEIQLKLSNPDTSIFDEAQLHIFNLMEKDSFRRFLARYSENN